MVGGGPQSSSTVQPCTLAPERGMEAPFRHLRFSVPHLMVQISTSFKVSLSPAAAPERVLIVPPTRYSSDPIPITPNSFLSTHSGQV